MRIKQIKPLAIGLFLAMAATFSPTYADGENHRERYANSLEPSIDHKETIVISLASNPVDDPEPACVAIQIGMNLLKRDLNDEEPGGKVTPADSVILFTTLDGVELVYENNIFSSQDCLTPKGPRSLSQLLTGFDALGGEVIVCPLCWMERDYDGTEPTWGTVADAFVIHDLFLYADKVISF